MESGTLTIVIFVSVLVGILILFCVYKTFGGVLLDTCCGACACDWCCDCNWLDFRWCCPWRQQRRQYDRPPPPAYPPSANLPIIIFPQQPSIRYPNNDDNTSSSDDDDGPERPKRQLTIVREGRDERVPVVV